MDFKKGDRNWTAPKKFEIKKEDKKTTKFWSGPSTKKDDAAGKRRRRGVEDDDESRRRRRQLDFSPDSGLESGAGRTSSLSHCPFPSFLSDPLSRTPSLILSNLRNVKDGEFEER
ncbi:uncharacterized protein LOC106011285 [Aplysia californica]|uniref:Uncharacterized protein LOC106011285 n=1 Tax=Aplysia californica TaxID=6500 RepID=A0ABM0ZWB2_APLCA|nr:uncharacterized protein LOC106011285 [Aplysia californica]